MKTIYRYEINDPSGLNKVMMPVSAKVISVGVADNDVISVWAMVETDGINSERTFIVAGTGADLDEVLTYDAKCIGTVNKSNRYAFHVFEVEDKKNIF